jgi:hypothetical protein
MLTHDNFPDEDMLEDWQDLQMAGWPDPGEQHESAGAGACGGLTWLVRYGQLLPSIPQC